MTETSRRRPAPEAARFRFRGTYRVQSRQSGIRSELAGAWIPEVDLRLTSSDMNRALAASPLWRGGSKVELRPATVADRTGAFAIADDALYYRDSFRPSSGQPAMLADILDVSKLAQLWKRRGPLLNRLLGEEVAAQLLDLGSDPGVVGATEYMCHEAGHAVGWDVGSKYESGYFRLSGTLTWPLIHVEEFRADMHSLGFALALLPPDEAAAVFTYHVLHRFGLAAESATSGIDGAGAVPYLLFCLLLDVEYLESPDGRILVALGRDQNFVHRTMAACNQHVEDALTDPEMGHASAIDVALNAAAYYRRRVLDETRVAMYRQWLLRTSVRSS